MTDKKPNLIILEFDTDEHISDTMDALLEYMELDGLVKATPAYNDGWGHVVHLPELARDLTPNDGNR